MLFLPFGWGSDGWCETRSYKKALKSYPEADGLMDVTTNYYRFKIPLIAITPVYKKITTSALAYRIKSEDELLEK